MSEQWVTLDAMPKNITFGATGVLAVIQNVRTILTTRKGTQPMDRDFGISFEFLDSPALLTRAKAEQECFMALRKYEPRAVLKGIRWETDLQSGKFWPDVLIHVVEQ
ncbi:MAG: GPW/gp25 family protein [Dysgonamonadaceae bacterium]|jgi:phage baseplate assembly protein W|nr:GPW/gp25 family protein [Dysgonamonadaceae bacterium]